MVKKAGDTFVACPVQSSARVEANMGTWCEMGNVSLVSVQS